MRVQRLRRRALGLALAVAAFAAVAAAVYPSIERFFLTRASDAGETTLRIAVEGLSGTLDRFEPLPKLIAERPILIDLLKDPTNEGLLPFVNEQLRLTAMTLGVSDVYLMDRVGTTIAASSYRKERSFVGRNFEFRPYFTQAIEGGLGRYFAMGTTSGERGYFFAAPVLDNTRVLGVIAIKFVVDPFEEAWRGGPSEILVTDYAGVVFMASRVDWHFRTLAPLASRDFARISRDRQYPLDQLLLLNLTRSDADGLSRMSIGDERFVGNETRLPQVGWTITHLTPVAPSRTLAALTLSGIGLVLLLTLLGSQIVLDRRARARERMENNLRAKARLEKQVAMRTEDLNAANAQLRTEIEERKATEQALRKTQRELVQAGKLAALGQMSAALSHEINQPLTAVKAYADNATTFLERNRVEDAAANVSRISKMADRMAALSAHLRNFARRPQETVETVDLSAIAKDAIAVMDVRLNSVGAELVEDGLDQPNWVKGGRVRLQQVIVNLIANALDAMSALEHPKITLGIDRTDDNVSLTVTDIGPGLSEDILDQIFDPFFTTKGPNHGLGLGLSISFNIVKDFGGHLSARNIEGGGAEFTLKLDAASPADQTTGVVAE